jgi:hypothetical protein
VTSYFQDATAPSGRDSNVDYSQADLNLSRAGQSRMIDRKSSELTFLTKVYQSMVGQGDGPVGDKLSEISVANEQWN